MPHRQKRDETILEQSDQRAPGKSERWTKEEHDRFVKAVETYGRKKQTQISKFVETKNVKQVISHSQKFYKKIDRAFEDSVTLSQDQFDSAVQLLAEIAREDGNIQPGHPPT